MFGVPQFLMLKKSVKYYKHNYVDLVESLVFNWAFGRHRLQINTLDLIIVTKLNEIYLLQ